MADAVTNQLYTHFHLRLHGGTVLHKKVTFLFLRFAKKSKSVFVALTKLVYAEPG